MTNEKYSRYDMLRAFKAGSAYQRRICGNTPGRSNCSQWFKAWLDKFYPVAEINKEVKK